MKKSKIKKLIKKELKKQCKLDLNGAVRGAIKKMEEGVDARELTNDEFVSSVLETSPGYIGNDVKPRQGLDIELHTSTEQSTVLDTVKLFLEYLDKHHKDDSDKRYEVLAMCAASHQWIVRNP